MHLHTAAATAFASGLRSVVSASVRSVLKLRRLRGEGLAVAAVERARDEHAQALRSERAALAADAAAAQRRMQDELDARDRRLAALEAELASARSDLSRQLEEARSKEQLLSATLSRTQAESEARAVAARDELEQARRLHEAQLAAVVDFAATREADLSERLSDAVRERDATIKEAADATIRVGEAHDELLSLRAARAEAERECRWQRAELERMRGVLADTERRCDEAVQGAGDRFERSLAELTRASQETERTLRAHADDAVAVATRFTQTEAGLRAEIDAARATIASLEQRLADAEDEALATKDVLRDLQESAATACDSEATVRRDLADAMQQLSLLQNRVESLSADLTTARSEKEALTSAFVGLSRGLQADATGAGTIGIPVDAHADAEEDAQAAEELEQAAPRDEEDSTSAFDLAALAARLDDNPAAASALSASASGSRGAKAATASSMGLLVQEMAATVRSRARLQTRLESAAAEGALQRRLLDTTRTSLAAAQDDIVQRELALDRVLQDHQELQNRVQVLEEELNTARAETVLFRVEAERCERDADTVQKQAAALEEELQLVLRQKDTLAVEKESLALRTAVAVEKADAAARHESEAVAEAQRTVDELQGRLTELESQLGEKDAVISDLQQKLADAEAAWALEREDLHSSVESLTEELQAREAEVHAVQQRLDVAEAAQAELSNEAAELREAVDSAKHDAAALADLHTEALADLQRAQSAAAAERDALLRQAHDDAARIEQDAADEREQLQADADAAYMRLQSEAEEEYARLRAEAETQCREVRVEFETEYEKKLQNATAEKEQLQSDAAAAAKRLLDEASAERDRIRREASAESERLSKELERREQMARADCDRLVQEAASEAVRRETEREATQREFTAERSRLRAELELVQSEKKQLQRELSALDRRVQNQAVRLEAQAAASASSVSPAAASVLQDLGFSPRRSVSTTMARVSSTGGAGARGAAAVEVDGADEALEALSDVEMLNRHLHALAEKAATWQADAATERTRGEEMRDAFENLQSMFAGKIAEYEQKLAEMFDSLMASGATLNPGFSSPRLIAQSGFTAQSPRSATLKSDGLLAQTMRSGDGSRGDQKLGFSHMAARLGELEVQLADARLQNTAQYGELSTLRAAVENTQAALTASKATVDELETRCESLQQERDAISASAKQTLAQLNDECVIGESEVAALRERLRAFEDMSQKRYVSVEAMQGAVEAAATSMRASHDLELQRMAAALASKEEALNAKALMEHNARWEEMSALAAKLQASDAARERLSGDLDTVLQGIGCLGISLHRLGGFFEHCIGSQRGEDDVQATASEFLANNQILEESLAVLGEAIATFQSAGSSPVTATFVADIVPQLQVFVSSTSRLPARWTQAVERARAKPLAEAASNLRRAESLESSLSAAVYAADEAMKDREALAGSRTQLLHEVEMLRRRMSSYAAELDKTKASNASLQSELAGARLRMDELRDMIRTGAEKEIHAASSQPTTLSSLNNLSSSGFLQRFAISPPRTREPDSSMDRTNKFTSTSKSMVAASQSGRETESGSGRLHREVPATQPPPQPQPTPKIPFSSFLTSAPGRPTPQSFPAQSIPMLSPPSKFRASERARDVSMGMTSAARSPSPSRRSMRSKSPHRVESLHSSVSSYQPYPTPDMRLRW
jgi:chromosome segregation ATPase